MSSDEAHGSRPGGVVVDYAPATGRRRRDRLNLVVGIVLWVAVAAVMSAYVAVELRPFINR